jgi:integrase
MARSVRARIETRSARLRLAGRKEPYWQTIERGLAVGYYRARRGGAGTWSARVLLEGRYKLEALATADDHTDADGETVLDWRQVQAAARAWAAKQTGNGPCTVKTACQDYVADLRARKGERAAKEADGRLKKHLLLVLGERRLADLTAAELTAWRNSLVADEDEEDEDKVRRSRDTANRLLSFVKAALNLARNSGRVADDSAWRTVKPFQGVGAARKIILSDAELQRLVDACGPGLRELVLLGAWTGARSGELAGARVRDFDRDEATLHVTGKTGSRDVYLAPPALALAKRLASGKRPADPLVTTAAGGPWTKSLHYRPFGEAVATAGLDDATTFYSLRHTFISRALKALVPVKAVADQCGTSMAMIERHYAKFIPSDLASYAAAAAPTIQVTATGKVAPIRHGAA